MRFLSKILFLLFTFYFLLSFKPVFASQEFSTSYDVSYEASLDGRLHIIQNISLTNKLSNIYATSYSLKLERGEPENVKAEDSLGLAKTSVETTNEETTIKVDFNEKVVGINKTLKFTLSYDAPELLRRTGQVWELTIPKLASPEDIDVYNLTLKIPLAFGKPAYVSPNPQTQRIEGDYQFFFFNKNHLVSSGVIAAFGEFQIFDFSLKYHLENPKDGQVWQKIALPPDTSYQKMSYWEIKPEPENVETDSDGNWLAIFKLKPKEELEIQVEGQVKIFANPTLKVEETEDNLESFLEEKNYWEINDPEISNLGKKLKTPKAIHEYIVKTLDYDFSRARIGAKRLGAKLALDNPQRAICTEYTDLFIALARAAGFPSRELNGFAYTTNPYLRPLSLAQDVLHSWPEYWDEAKKTWIQIDPTWQDTTGGINYFDKLDLGHFVFAIHGKESNSPPPAGAYKKSGLPQKDVQVSFGKPKEGKPTLPELEFLLPKEIFSEKGESGTIVLENSGTEAIYDLNLALSGTNIKVRPYGETYFEILPPFSKRLVPVKISSEKITYQGQGKLTALLNDKKIEYNFFINSLILNYFLPIFGGLLGAATLLIIARKIRRLYIQKRQERDSLYRQGNQSSKKS
ncbi:MAG: transglutaminase-like domain-containing protein [Patescibacteria group bacterium]